MKKKKTRIIIIIIIAAAAAAAVLFFVFKNNVSGDDTSSKVMVQTVGDICEDTSTANKYNGIVTEQEKSSIEFDPSRTLKELNVETDQHVNKGDVLFSYDTESINLEIEQLNLEIDRLNTDLTNYNTQLTQLNTDIQKASDEDKLEYTSRIAQTQSSIAQAQYDIKTKQAEISKKEAAITASSITAPITGAVSSIADADAIINGTNIDSTGSSSNVYITIVAEGDLRIKGTISENNIMEIETGEDMIIVSRLDSSQTWNGTIKSIDTSSTDDSSSSMMYYSTGETASKYNFYVDLESADGLMIGQHVLIRSADTALLTDGLWLSSGWIGTDEDGSYYVWTAAYDGAPLTKTEVTLGTYLEELDVYEVLSGITETDYIAWPDTDCYEGAATTTEMVVTEDESTTTDSEGNELGLEDLTDSFDNTDYEDDEEITEYKVEEGAAGDDALNG